MSLSLNLSEQSSAFLLTGVGGALGVVTALELGDNEGCSDAT